MSKQIETRARFLLVCGLGYQLNTAELRNPVKFYISLKTWNILLTATPPFCTNPRHFAQQYATIRDIMHFIAQQRLRKLQLCFFGLSSKNCPVLYSNRVQSRIRDLVRQTAMTVMNHGGVVRSLNSWGTRSLPAQMRRHEQKHTIGECVTINTAHCNTLS